MPELSIRHFVAVDDACQGKVDSWANSKSSGAVGIAIPSDKCIESA